MSYEPYPRSLYRQVESGHPEMKFDGVQCEMLTVESEEEEAAAKKAGWHNSPAEAGGAKPAKAPKAEEKHEDDPRVPLRAEYTALAGKKPFTGWSAEQLSEKIAALKAA